MCVGKASPLAGGWWGGRALKVRLWRAVGVSRGVGIALRGATLGATCGIWLVGVVQWTVHRRRGCLRAELRGRR